MNETYIRVKGQWYYLFRAVDKEGQTIDFLLTAQRDKEAALRFLKKAIRCHRVPETITIDGSEANAATIWTYNEEYGTTIAIRQVKYFKKKQLLVEAGDEGLTTAENSSPLPPRNSSIDRLHSS